MTLAGFPSISFLIVSPYNGIGGITDLSAQQETRKSDVFN